jgi:hypothetical protein
MGRHKDFGGGTDITDYEPLSFSLVGQNFNVVPAVQGHVLLNFVANASGNDGAAAAKALDDFFAKIMEPQEFTRFKEHLDNPRVIIDMEKLGEIAGWLIEEYSARPTQPPSSSADGESTTGTSSMDEPSSKVSV